ncbi:MAG: hypothetical protein D6689_22225 [Deltaproteobacteria bacterium]|nr:MAG: hypothetical protein D6689_22225 [Deltaproteobacteria bacterium]
MASLQGVAGAGTLELSADERAWLDEQIARARALAASGATRFFGDGPPAPPRWVWAIALRCAGGVRVLEGGGRDTRSAPPGLAPLLAWLRDRVDREANGRPARRRGGLREALAAAARGVARAARFRR